MLTRELTNPSRVDQRSFEQKDYCLIYCKQKQFLLAFVLQARTFQVDRSDSIAITIDCTRSLFYTYAAYT